MDIYQKLCCLKSKTFFFFFCLFTSAQQNFPWVGFNSFLPYSSTNSPLWDWAVLGLICYKLLEVPDSYRGIHLVINELISIAGDQKLSTVPWQRQKCLSLNFSSELQGRGRRFPPEATECKSVFPNVQRCRVPAALGDQGGTGVWWNSSSNWHEIASTGSGEESRTRSAHPLITLIWHMFLISWKEQDSLSLERITVVVLCYSCFVNIGFMF